MLTSSSLYALNMILAVVVHMYDTRVSACVRVSECVCVCLNVAAGQKAKTSGGYIQF